jgi:hypothetical protein
LINQTGRAWITRKSAPKKYHPCWTAQNLFERTVHIDVAKALTETKRALQQVAEPAEFKIDRR